MYVSMIQYPLLKNHNQLFHIIKDDIINFYTDSDTVHNLLSSHKQEVL